MFEVVPKNGQTWLICGGRNFNDLGVFDNAMGDLMRLKGCPDTIIHGGARGADTLADEWGKRMALRILAMPADWDRHGRSAGPLRNQAMLAKGPQLVVAFPGGKGTADMVRRAREMNVDVAEIAITSGDYRTGKAGG